MRLRRRLYRSTLLAAALLCGLSLRALAQASPYVTEAGSQTLSFGWFGSGSFNVALSTEAGFATRLSSGAVAANTTAYFNLSVNATHYFRVKQAGAPEAAYEILSVSTSAAAPGTPSFNTARFEAASSFTAAAGLAWNTAGNPDWTSYEVQFATAADFTGAMAGSRAMIYSDPVAGGLYANTLYHFRVRALAFRGGASGWSAAAATTTYSVQSAASAQAVYRTSAAISWDQVSNPSVPPLDSAGYRLLYSSDENMVSPSVWSTAADTTVSAAITGLAANTTYYFRLGTLNSAGAPNYSDRKGLMTLTSAPQQPALLVLDDASATLGWAAFPASPQTASASGYRLEASSSPLFGAGLVESSATWQLAQSTLAINTLFANTTYYFRVGALNSAGGAAYGPQYSTVTLALPVPENLVTVQAGGQGVSAFYTPNETSPRFLASEGYLLQAATEPFGGGGTVYSSATADGALDRLTIPGLQPNTTYYLRLGTLNLAGRPNFTDLPPVTTRTGARPGSPAVFALSSGAASVGFTPVPLEAPDGYVAEASRNYPVIPALVVAYSSTTDAGLSTLTVRGLAPNTSYYIRVGALYHGATEYADAAPAPAPVWTLPQSLDGVAFAPGAVFSSSVTLTWDTYPSTGAAFYRAEASTGAAFLGAVFVSSSADPATAALSLTGLQPDTSYYFRAGAFNAAGGGYFTEVAAATSTLADQPAWTSYSISSETLRVNWQGGANPPDTRYLISVSSYSNFIPARSSDTALTTAFFDGLQPNTTFYVSAQSRNRLGRRGAPVAFPDIASGAKDPGGLVSAQAGTASVTVSWSDGGNIPSTVYRVRLSSSPSMAFISSVTEVMGGSATFYGLLSNASYYADISALSLGGIPTDPPVQLGVWLTQANPPAVPADLSAAFTARLLDGFTFNWQHNNNAADTEYEVRVASFQAGCQASTSVWTASGAEKVTAGGLAVDTLYWACVRTRSGQSSGYTAYTGTGPVRTLTSVQTQAVYQADTLVTLPAYYGDFTVRLPPGALGGSSEIGVSPRSSFTVAPAAGAGLLPTGVGVNITQTPKTLVLGGIEITVPYRDGDMTGFDESRLVLALFDEENGIWVPLQSSASPAANRVTGRTWHLSVFQIMQLVPASTLAEVKIYPNPYRPNSEAGLMRFVNLPPHARIRIYTFLGELVRSLRADINGMAGWDGRNEKGQVAGSGVYVAEVRASGAGSKIYKVAVER